jgi:hypothetical protein
MVGCVSSHKTPWFNSRGTEEVLLVVGDIPEGNLLELVYQCADGAVETALLNAGENPFPQGATRFAVNKHVSVGAPVVSTTVRVFTSR